MATFSPDEVGQGDSWGVSVMSDGDVRIVYDVGSCGGEAQALTAARSVNASYAEDEIVLRVDGSVECEGDSTDIAFLRAAVLTLDQPVGDRSIRLEN